MGHLDAKNVITKIPFAAALVKHTNNPIWRKFIFSIAVVNILLFFDCGRLFIKIFNKMI